MAPALEISGLRKSVPGGRVLFEGLQLCLEPGDFVAVMGESGVGKSTFLNLIAGLDVADRGEIRVGGVDLAKLDDDARTRLRRDRIGFVFQAFHVLPHLTLGQNVALPLALQGAREPGALAKAGEMLEAVGLHGRASDYPKQLSGGEMQRVAIARALVHEPTGNLDPETASRVLDVFAEQIRRSGAAALLVTHSEVAAAAAHRTLVLGRSGLTARHAG